ncbi:MAG: hypothetical protein V3V13_12105 [Paracoccaceae bacterium]
MGIRNTSLRVSPLSGPDGTSISIRIRGALAHDPITITIGPGSTGVAADIYGESLTMDRIAGFPPESAVLITVIIGTGANDQTRQATFHVTG